MKTKFRKIDKKECDLRRETLQNFSSQFLKIWENESSLNDVKRENDSKIRNAIKVNFAAITFSIGLFKNKNISEDAVEPVITSMNWTNLTVPDRIFQSMDIK